MSRPGSATAVVLAFIVAALMSGCAGSASKQPAAFVPVPPPADVEYAIQPGDALAIRFYYHPDHDQPSVLVRNDGRIMLPLAGDVEAAGLKPSELSRRLEKAYSSNLREPEIAVTITTVYQDLVWIGGEVNNVGFVRYRPGLTAVEAILAAGGPRNTAATDECLLLQRVGRSEYRSSRIDLSKAIFEGDEKANFVLGPQDVIFIPKTAIAKANVIVDQYFIKMIPIRFTERLDRQTNSSGSDESGQKNETKSTPATRRPSDTSSQPASSPR